MDEPAIARAGVILVLVVNSLQTAAVQGVNPLLQPQSSHSQHNTHTSSSADRSPPSFYTMPLSSPSGLVTTEVSSHMDMVASRLKLMTTPPFRWAQTRYAMKTVSTTKRGQGRTGYITLPGPRRTRAKRKPPITQSGHGGRRAVTLPPRGRGPSAGGGAITLPRSRPVPLPSRGRGITLPSRGRGTTQLPRGRGITLPARRRGVTLPAVTLPPRGRDVTLPPVTLPTRGRDITLPPVTLPPRGRDITLPPITLPPKGRDVTLPPITLPPRGREFTLPAWGRDVTLPSGHRGITLPSKGRDATFTPWTRVITLPPRGRGGATFPPRRSAITLPTRRWGITLPHITNPPLTGITLPTRRGGGRIPPRTTKRIKYYPLRTTPPQPQPRGTTRDWYEITAAEPEEPWTAPKWTLPRETAATDHHGPGPDRFTTLVNLYPGNRDITTSIATGTGTGLLPPSASPGLSLALTIGLPAAGLVIVALLIIILVLLCRRKGHCQKKPKKADDVDLWISDDQDMTVPRNMKHANGYATSKRVVRYRVVVPYQALGDDHLNLQEGDYVEDLQIRDGGWWWGRVGQRQGLFPAGYVEQEYQDEYGLDNNMCVEDETTFTTATVYKTSQPPAHVQLRKKPSKHPSFHGVNENGAILSYPSANEMDFVTPEEQEQLKRHLAAKKKNNGHRGAPSTQKQQTKEAKLKANRSSLPKPPNIPAAKLKHSNACEIPRPPVLPTVETKTGQHPGSLTPPTLPGSESIPTAPSLPKSKDMQHSGIPTAPNLPTSKPKEPRYTDIPIPPNLPATATKDPQKGMSRPQNLPNVKMKNKAVRNVPTPPALPDLLEGSSRENLHQHGNLNGNPDEDNEVDAVSDKLFQSPISHTTTKQHAGDSPEDSPVSPLKSALLAEINNRKRAEKLKRQESGNLSAWKKARKKELEKDDTELDNDCKDGTPNINKLKLKLQKQIVFTTPLSKPFNVAKKNERNSDLSNELNSPRESIDLGNMRNGICESPADDDGNMKMDTGNLMSHISNNAVIEAEKPTPGGKKKHLHKNAGVANNQMETEDESLWKCSSNIKLKTMNGHNYSNGQNYEILTKEFNGDSLNDNFYRTKLDNCDVDTVDQMDNTAYLMTNGVDSDPEKEPDSEEEVENEDTYIATFPYTPAQPDELQLEVHDLLTYIEEEEPDWMKGIKLSTGEVGWFPKIYVRKVTEPAPDQSYDPYHNLYHTDHPDTDEEFDDFQDIMGIEHRALYPYKPQQEGDLTFQAGDILVVLEVQENGWWRGCLGDQEGWFPGSYVQMMPQTPAPAEQTELPFPVKSTTTDTPHIRQRPPVPKRFIQPKMVSINMNSLKRRCKREKRKRPAPLPPIADDVKLVLHHAGTRSAGKKPRPPSPSRPPPKDDHVVSTQGCLGGPETAGTARQGPDVAVLYPKEQAGRLHNEKTFQDKDENQYEFLNGNHQGRRMSIADALAKMLRERNILLVDTDEDNQPDHRISGPDSPVTGQNGPASSPDRTAVTGQTGPVPYLPARTVNVHQACSTRSHDGTVEWSTHRDTKLSSNSSQVHTDKLKSAPVMTTSPGWDKTKAGPSGARGPPPARPPPPVVKLSPPKPQGPGSAQRIGSPPCQPVPQKPLGPGSAQRVGSSASKQPAPPVPNRPAPPVPTPPLLSESSVTSPSTASVSRPSQEMAKTNLCGVSSNRSSLEQEPRRNSMVQKKPERLKKKRPAPPKPPSVRPNLMVRGQGDGCPARPSGPPMIHSSMKPGVRVIIDQQEVTDSAC